MLDEQALLSRRVNLTTKKDVLIALVNEEAKSSFQQ